MKNELELNTQWGTVMEVQLDINCYFNNGGMYIGLISKEDGQLESYGDVTVNLEDKAPDCCGYIDTNNMPELEQFIKDNDLGEFTGITRRSGFCEYPLYLFNEDKLRELCPDGMKTYEDACKQRKESVKVEKSR